uniref:Anoctamin n=1 Tax=Mesocestoides corti TaxID=53468 RepID=A0A5K3FJ75_MESCO
MVSRIWAACNEIGLLPGRFAALWPFIGILAELIVLLITIIIYERHKAAKKKRAAECDPLLTTTVSPSGDTKSAGGAQNAPFLFNLVILHPTWLHPSHPIADTHVANLFCTLECLCKSLR